MNNKLKKLLIPAIAMLLLIVALVVYVIISKSNSDDNVEENLDIVLLHETQISKLTVQRKNATDLIVSCSIDDQGHVTYKYLSDDAASDVQVSDDAVSSFLSVLASFRADQKLSSVAALAEYGLDDPEYRLTYNLSDGKTIVLLIGKNTYDNSKCYFMLEGSSDVYTISSMKKTYCDYTITNFLQTKAINVNINQVASVEFDRKSDNTHIVAECTSVDTARDSDASFFITEPYSVKASTHFSSLMSQIFELEISSYIDIPEGEIGLYGLKDPQYHFAINKKDGEKIELYLSSLIGDVYYGYSNITDKYFCFSSLQLTFLDNSISTLIDSFVAYFYAYEISSITGKYNGTEFRFDLEVDSNKSISDETSKVKLDNRNAKIFTSEGRSFCAILYESLASIDVAGVDVDAKPTLTDPVMTLTFRTKDYQTYKYDFVKRTANTYYVFVNDKYSCFYVESDALFANGGTDTYGYGVWGAYELLVEAIEKNVGGIYDIPA